MNQFIGTISWQRFVIRLIISSIIVLNYGGSILSLRSSRSAILLLWGFRCLVLGRLGCFVFRFLRSFVLRCIRSSIILARSIRG